MLPGPFWLIANSEVVSDTTRNTATIMGTIIPSNLCALGVAFPRLKPFFRNTTPSAIPAAKPTSPTHAFKSPAPMRKIIRSGQPKNTSAPIIMKKLNTKRATGAEPPFGLNSLRISAIQNAPSTMPIISGRIY